MEMKAKELVGKMTLDEKVKLVVGLGMKIPGMPAMDNNLVDKVPGSAGSTFAIPRLGIPSIIVADGPAGLRIQPTREKDSTHTYYCTAFPIATLLASTWDTTLVKNVGKAMGSEVKEYGVDIILGPGLNIHRNPLGARNFEYYSEDPYITGYMTAAMVNGIQSNNVGTSIKHFAANNQETNRMLVNVLVSQRALREIYLRGFEMAIKKAHPWTVMSSYNQINGTYTSQSYNLLTSILRKEWGFKGLVMTDWFGGTDPVAQMKAGNDLLMPGTSVQVKAIADAANNGSLDVQFLDENAERIVNLILGSQTYKQYAATNAPNLKANAVIARTAAADGMVLLKNDNNTLPLSKNIKRIAAFGNTSYDFISGGTGSGDVNEAYTISLEQGLSSAGYLVDENLKHIYVAYLTDYKAKHPKKNFMEEFFNPTPPVPEYVLTSENINQTESSADIALITIGRNAGEGSDRKKENDFDLTDVEKTLIKNVANAYHAKGKKVFVVLNIGGVIETASWRNDVDAILLTWQGGQEAGNAVVDLLTGKVNPSGKLASTFPLTYDDVPSAKNFPGKNLSAEMKRGMGGMPLGFESEVVYEEGIYVGYRYYNSFQVKTAYPFGFGLSYTKFTYANLQLNSKQFNGKIVASIEVTNAGQVAGKEAVQLYVAAPAKSLQKPAMELKAFGKTNLLQPGQKQILQFELNAKDLASFDTPTSSWIAEAGNYIVKLGASSDNILQTVSFTVPKQLMVEKCENVLQPTVEIKEMKR